MRALRRAGFIEKRQAGGHVILRHETDQNRWASVPVHGTKPVKPGTLRQILKSVEITADELRALL